jgi:aspartate-semialdehyde dehydrogenase
VSAADDFDAAETGATVAVVGAAGIAGAQIIEVLLECGLPLRRLFALDEGAAGGSISCGDREVDVRSLDDFDFSAAGCVIFAGEEATTAAWAGEASSAGAQIVDASGYFGADPDVPLLAGAGDVDRIEAGRRYGIIAVTAPATTALIRVLQPIVATAGLERLDVVSLQSVSAAGRAAVEELGQQTSALLNFREADVEALPKRIAFNLLPQVGAPGADGATRGEARMLNELSRSFADATPVVRATAVHAPLFYGDALVVHLRTRTPLTLEQAQGLLENAAGVVVAAGGDIPTPAIEAVGGGEVHVGRLRLAADDGCSLQLWLAYDGLRAGLAEPCAAIVQTLIGA